MYLFNYYFILYLFKTGKPMDTNLSSIHTRATEWLDKGYDNQQISDELMKLGIEEGHVPEMLKEIVKLRNSRKTASGLVFILIGAVICLISCIVTLTSDTHNITFVLYGLTSLGIIIVFGGLMKIFS